jgi:hypothetical protein
MVVAMRSQNEGILQLQASGRWAVFCPNRRPVELTSGEVFRIQVDDMPGLQVTRMEFRHFQGPMKGRSLRGSSGEYYSVDGYWLRNGLRAAIGVED